MCGIVGYVGPKKPIPILIGGLQNLEYRGYDSAGVATHNNGAFEVFRSQGKLLKLKELLESKGQSLDFGEGEKAINVGIGHTRWATHGKPSETNAHPHVAGNICIVHNGIIENYAELKKQLKEKGCEFFSETDTEIAAHLINQQLKTSSSLIEAVRKSIAQMQGSYALVVTSLNDPDRLVVAKNATPIVIGVAKGEVFVASDIPAVLSHTRDFIILEDDELAELTTESISIEKNGQPFERQPIHVDWDPVTAEKGGYDHFMLKEIFEQPQAVTDTLRGRLERDSVEVFLDDFNLTDADLKKIERVHFVACGTAWHAALVTKFYIEKFARIPVEVDYGSECRYREMLVNDKTLFIAVSQSGETADTLGSLKRAKSLGAKTAAICNVVGSSIAREAENIIYTHAGPEISVASTKAFVTQLTAGAILALKLAVASGAVDKAELKERMKQLSHLPIAIADALLVNDKVKEIARKYSASQNFLFLGRGFLYPIALEGALKLKEVSYIHAEGYPAGEMKHGPIALVTEETPVVVVIGHDDVNYEKTMSNLIEVQARGGKVIAVTDVSTEQLEEVATEIIAVGEVPHLILPATLTIPMQLFAYYVAVARGTDVDQPRNLAKSVTVE